MVRWLLVILLAWLGMVWSQNLLAIVTLPFFIAGMSVAHALIERTRSPLVFILFFYVLLLLLFNVLFLVLAGIGVADSMLDFRKMGHAKRGRN